MIDKAISNGAWSMKNIAYIKNAFDARMLENGYQVRYRRSGQGYHKTGYSKVVSREYVFYPLLGIAPDRAFPGERYLVFETGIDLLLDLFKRFPSVPEDFMDSENLCTIHVGLPEYLNTVDPKMALALTRSNWFRAGYTWQIGKTISDARAFVEEVLPLLMQMLIVYEKIFTYPSPIDRFTLRDLELLRTLQMRPQNLTAQPSEDRLGYGLAVRADAMASLLLSFYARKQDGKMVHELEEFLRQKPDPFGASLSVRPASE